CANSHVPPELMRLLDGKEVLVGAIDVASDVVETPEQVAATLRTALRYMPAEKLYPCTNCGMAPLDRRVARGKLEALAKGAALPRRGHGGRGVVGGFSAGNRITSTGVIASVAKQSISPALTDGSWIASSLRSSR